MADGSLGGVVRGLGLRDVDHSTGHAANHDNAAGGLALDQMTGNASSKEVASVDIDSPALLHPLVGVLNGIKVLGETGGGDEVVNAAVLGDDVFQGLVDRVWTGDIGIVCSNLGWSFQVSIELPPA